MKKKTLFLSTALVSAFILGLSVTTASNGKFMNLFHSKVGDSTYVMEFSKSKNNITFNGEGHWGKANCSNNSGSLTRRFAYEKCYNDNDNWACMVKNGWFGMDSVESTDQHGNSLTGMTSITYTTNHDFVLSYGYSGYSKKDGADYEPGLFRSVLLKGDATTRTFEFSVKEGLPDRFIINNYDDNALYIKDFKVNYTCSQDSLTHTHVTYKDDFAKDERVYFESCGICSETITKVNVGDDHGIVINDGNTTREYTPKNLLHYQNLGALRYNPANQMFVLTADRDLSSSYFEISPKENVESKSETILIQGSGKGTGFGGINLKSGWCHSIIQNTSAGWIASENRSTTLRGDVKFTGGDIALNITNGLVTVAEGATISANGYNTFVKTTSNKTGESASFINNGTITVTDTKIGFDNAKDSGDTSHDAYKLFFNNSVNLTVKKTGINYFDFDATNTTVSIKLDTNGSDYTYGLRLAVNRVALDNAKLVIVGSSTSSHVHDNGIRFQKAAGNDFNKTFTFANGGKIGIANVEWAINCEPCGATHYDWGDLTSVLKMCNVGDPAGYYYEKPYCTSLNASEFNAEFGTNL